jgi:glycosyltransferase involved in cell wall biosynthesis
MKRILFVIPTLGNGGAEKSFLSVLESLDYSEFEVDVLALRPTGLISQMLPPQVNVLPLERRYVNFKKPLPASILAFAKSLSFCDVFNRIAYSFILKKYRMSNYAEQRAFRYLKGFLNNGLHYDVAISYLEKTSNYFVSECVDADTKIGYIHSDYEKLGLDPELDMRLMKNLDYLVTVSDMCADILKESLPAFAGRVRVIENIISKKTILERAGEFLPYNDSFDGIRIATVGRLSYEKGPDIALEACRLLVEGGYNIKWHMIGAIDMEGIVESAEKYGLKGRFIFENLQSNPYCYVFNSDIYVQSSRREGKSIAVEEAKVLGIPVVLSNYSTAPCQINNGITGIIADDISAQSVAAAIKNLIDDKALYNNIKQALKKEAGNEHEINRLVDLINSKGQQ